MIYNWVVTPIEYLQPIPPMRGTCPFGIGCNPKRRDTRGGCLSFREIRFPPMGWRARKDESMASKSEIPPDVVTAIVQSSERLEGAASILVMLEENASGSGPGVKASKLAAVRSIIEASVKQLDEAWEEI